MRDISYNTLIAICSFSVVLPIQLLLCFEVKKFLLKLLPSILLTATSVFLFIKMRITTGWDAFGYALIFMFSIILLIFSGIAWGIWAIINLIKNKRCNRSNSTR